MTNYTLTIHYNTTISAHSLAAYRVSIEPTTEAPTGKLSQRGPVFNNVLITRGTFANLSDATKALLGYVNTSCVVVECSDPISSAVKLVRHGKLPRTGEFTTARVLGSRTRKGEYIAA